MSTYIISAETRRIAKKMNLQIYVSSNPKKKIDVINSDGKKFSIGDVKYGDFHTHKKISLDPIVESLQISNRTEKIRRLTSLMKRK